MRSWRSVVAVLMVAVVSVAVGFTFHIEASTEECFYEVVEQGQSIGIMYQVTAGGLLDINLQVTAPDQTVILNKRKEGEGKYTLNAHVSGQYAICFSNHMSRLTAKDVDLELTVSQPGQSAADDLAKKEHLDPLEQQIVQLSAAISSVHNEQKYLKMREVRHRYTSDSTNSRILWWTLTEAAILIGASLFQVYYLRRFFEEKRTI